MGGAVPSRLTPDTPATLKEQLATQVQNNAPTVLRDWGANLLGQEGARPDDRGPPDSGPARRGPI
jgi:hypothetical protein